MFVLVFTKLGVQGVQFSNYKRCNHVTTIKSNLFSRDLCVCNSLTP